MSEGTYRQELDAWERSRAAEPQREPPVMDERDIRRAKTGVAIGYVVDARNRPFNEYVDVLNLAVDEIESYWSPSVPEGMTAEKLQLLAAHLEDRFDSPFLAVELRSWADALDGAS